MIEVKIKTLSTLEVDKGMYYEMLDPEGYHYVRPVHGVAKTIMVTGKPWITKESFKSSKQLEKLHDARKEEIREWFLRYYIRQNFL